MNAAWTRGAAQVTEYLLEPLRAACRDTDPYVRKTAAICIAKLHDIAPEEARARI